MGVRFSSSFNGFITGIRFYKGVNNTGTHIGNLWSNTGTLLARATFTGETATGWQQVNFSSPVAITANTVYVASYFSPTGDFSVDRPYFATMGVNNPPLSAPMDGGAGAANGIFTYGSTSQFPTSSYQSSNYWVDVVYNSTAAGAPLTVATGSPLLGGTQGSAYNQTLTAGGGTPPYSWTLVSGSNLPAGLTLSTGGVISGTPTGTGTTSFTVQVTDSSSPVQTAQATLSITITTAAPPPTCPCTIWPSTTVPGTTDINQSQPVELGVRFAANSNGFITGIRFYKGVNNTGTHIGNLWSNTGTLLARATFTGETATGWQQVNFSSPVAITANTVYVASYFSPTGDFAINRPYFATTGVNNPPLQALVDGGSGGANGVFTYGSTSQFPTSSYQSSNYWVDVVYNSTAGGAPLTVATGSPLLGGTQGSAYNQTLTAGGGTPPYSWTLVSGSNLPAGLTLSTGGVISGTPTGTGTTSFTVQVTDSSSPVQNAQATLSITITTAAPPPTCPCTIWPSTTVPGTTDINQSQPVELGVRFAANSNGFITGIRFYKGVNNTGTHIGNLWSNTGTLLARATFTGETATGWQQVNFSSPVAITANTVYVASYFSPTGDFAINRPYFATTGVNNPPLQALVDGGSGGANGIFTYGSTSQFPTSSYQSSNYWVDVVYNSTAGGAPLTVATGSPLLGGTQGSAYNQTLTAGGGTPPYSWTLVSGSNLPAGLTLSTGGVISGTPTGTGTTSFTVQVTDSSSPVQTAQATLSITITTAAPPPTCPCTIWPSTTVPGTTDINQSQPVELGVRFAANSNGFITGIRFYKGVNNTGTHIGNLWSNTGTLLARATFTGETATGWQQVNFSSPVAITANTVYVASYFSPTGDFAINRPYFATTGVNNPPLQALVDGGSGGANGIFTYGSTSQFPTSSYQSSNYWVDVVYTQ